MCHTFFVDLANLLPTNGAIRLVLFGPIRCFLIRKLGNSTVLLSDLATVAAIKVFKIMTKSEAKNFK